MHVDSETYLDLQEDTTSPSPWEPYRKQVARFCWALAIAGCFYLSFLLWGDNLRAQWSLFDDHEILQILGPGGKLHVSDMARQLRGTEVGQFGKSVRFRPGYYVLRLVECCLWGDSPRAWYLARLVMFAVFAGIAVFLVSRAAGLLVAVCVVLFSLSARYWPSIWACLGPAETYAAVGCALFGLGVYLVWNSLQPAVRPPWYRNLSHWLLIGTGGFMAIGSKENFLLLAPIVVVLALYAWRKRALTVAGCVVTTLTIAYAAWIAAAVALALKSTGRDIYQASVSPASRLQALAGTLAHASPVLLLCPVVGAAWAATWLLRRRYPLAGRWRSALRSIFLIEGLLLLAFFALLYFYNGAWPEDSRYAFPGVMILEATAFVPLLYLLRKPELFGPNGSVYAPKLRKLLVIALLFLTWCRGFEYAISISRQNEISTRAVAGTVNRVEKAVKGRDTAIVLLSCTLGDWEGYYSLKAFFRARGLANPIIVEKCAAGYSTEGFAPALADAGLKSVLAIQNGAHGFAPRSLLDGPTKCVVLGLSREPDFPRCDSIGKLNR